MAAVNQNHDHDHDGHSSYALQVASKRNDVNNNSVHSGEHISQGNGDLSHLVPNVIHSEGVDHYMKNEGMDTLLKVGSVSLPTDGKGAFNNSITDFFEGNMAQVANIDKSASDIKFIGHEIQSAGIQNISAAGALEVKSPGFTGAHALMEEQGHQAGGH